MYALITGASSGIGYEFATKLANCGYDLILVSRRENRLNELKNKLNCKCVVIPLDLTSNKAIDELILKISTFDIKLVINNAGFGECGYFLETDISKEESMIDLNVKAMYLLFKKMAQRMNDGYILNVASIAGLLPGGAYMSQYYATKAYVTSLTLGVSEELRQRKSKLHVGCLCPGPVNTEFNDVANVKFALKGISSEKCVSYALKKIKKNKTIIIPGFTIRMANLFSRFVPKKMLIKIVSYQQKKKIKE